MASRALSASPTLTAFCRADRASLLYQVGAPPRALPAEWLDSVIEDLLQIGLASAPLPGQHLGRCDYALRVITVNSRMAAITFPNTYLDGVVNSTKAHELAHLRFQHHEAEVRQLACHGESGLGRRGSAALKLCEFEANYYAGVFLVPSESLAAEPEAGQLRAAARAGDDVASDDLWALAVALGRRYQVTGSLMATRLSHLGLLVKDERVLRLPCGLSAAHPVGEA